MVKMNFPRRVAAIILIINVASECRLGSRLDKYSVYKKLGK